MASTSPTRIDDELYESARVVGRRMDRSVSQQLAHWARIGRELETGPTVSVQAVADVLAGDRDYDLLGTEEQAVVRAAWGERVADRLAGLNLAATFAAEGRSYVELADDGSVVRRTPAPTAGRRGRPSSSTARTTAKAGKANAAGKGSRTGRARASGEAAARTASERQAERTVAEQQAAARRR